MESKIKFKCGNITLEGCLDERAGADAAVICHPHPLYGGNMENSVVLAIAGAFAKNGISTLRFNFRGTGNSSGMFDNGTGEQDDVRAALTFLEEKGYDKIRLAGYSFGSRVNAGVVCGGCRIHDHIMVSPPAAFMSFDEIETLPDTGLIITGTNDDIAPPQTIQAHIERWGIHPRLEVITGGNHFYSGSLKKLAQILDDYLG